MGRGEGDIEALLAPAPAPRPERPERARHSPVLVELFEALSRKKFQTARELDSAIIEEFNERLRQFPAHYTYRDAISYARKRGWITQTERSIFIQLPW